jgi:hypothetical protein
MNKTKDAFMNEAKDEFIWCKKVVNLTCRKCNFNMFLTYGKVFLLHLHGFNRRIMVSMFIFKTLQINNKL